MKVATQTLTTVQKVVKECESLKKQMDKLQSLPLTRMKLSEKMQKVRYDYFKKKVVIMWAILAIWI